MTKRIPTTRAKPAVSEDLSTDWHVLHAMAALVHQVSILSKQWTGVPQYFDVIRFTGANFARLIKEDNKSEVWGKASLIKEYSIEIITAETTRMIYLALMVGKIINQYRKIIGRTPIDWIKAATTMAIEEERNAT